jgi:hypothetical protein
MMMSSCAAVGVSFLPEYRSRLSRHSIQARHLQRKASSILFILHNQSEHYSYFCAGVRYRTLAPDCVYIF